MININDRLAELQEKINELDSLIGDTLDNEPEEAVGTYGAKIQELFNNTSWIDAVIMKMN